MSSSVDVSLVLLNPVTPLSSNRSRAYGVVMKAAIMRFDRLVDLASELEIEHRQTMSGGAKVYLPSQPDQRPHRWPMSIAAKLQDPPRQRHGFGDVSTAARPRQGFGHLIEVPG